jgi:hypothetical protein
MPLRDRQEHVQEFAAKKLLLASHPVPEPNRQFQEIIRRRWCLPTYLRSRARMAPPTSVDTG